MINFFIRVRPMAVHQHHDPIVAQNLTLTGTSGDDVLVGGLGNDTIDPGTNIVALSAAT